MGATCGYNKRAVKCKAPSRRRGLMGLGRAARTGHGALACVRPISGTRAGEARVGMWRPRGQCEPAAQLAARSRLRADEDGLDQALALETAAGELGVGHLRQQLEARGGRVRLMDDVE